VFHLLRKLNTATGPAFILSLIYAVHPANVSSVAWIPALNDVMLAVFVFSSFITYINLVRTGKWYWYALHLVLFIAGLLTKETIIIFPVVLLSYYLLFSERRKISHVALMAVSWLVILAVWFVLRQQVRSDMTALESLTILKVLKNLALGWAGSYGRMIVPLYGRRMVSLIAGGLMIPLTVLLFLGFRPASTKKVLFGAIWFFSFLIVPAVFKGGFSDTWLYTAAAGGLMVFGELRINVIPRVMGVIMITLIVLGYAFYSVLRLPVYRDELTFADFYLSEHPDETVSHYIRAIALGKKGDYREAVIELDGVVRDRPSYMNAFYNRGLDHMKLREYRRAVQDFSTVIGHAPGFPNVFYERGMTYLHLNVYDSAVNDLTEAIRQRPRYLQGYFSRSAALVRLRRYGEAIDDMTTVIRLDPGNERAYYQRGLKYIITGEYAEALSDLSKVKTAAGEGSDIYFFKGTALYGLKKYDDALAHFRKALEVNPADARACYYAALCCEATGDRTGASDYLTKARAKGFKVSPEVWARIINR
jgi:tetratricopeptide (TPR) repeat protein